MTLFTNKYRKKFSAFQEVRMCICAYMVTTPLTFLEYSHVQKGWCQICSLTHHGIEKHISHFPLLSLLKEGCRLFSFKLQRIGNCNNSWILKKVHFPCSDFTLCSATDVYSNRFKHVIWWKNFYYIRTSRDIIYSEATISFEKSNIVSPIYEDSCLWNPVWKKRWLA